jgi:hypothetical protein
MVNHVILVALTAVIVPLASARLARIINTDRIAQKLRDWVEAQAGLDSMTHYAVSICYWCLSVWTSLFWTGYALASWTIFGPLPWHIAALLYIPASLAVSDIAGRILDSEGI